MGGLVVRASNSRRKGLVPFLNCEGGDRWCHHLSSPVWWPRPTTGVLLAPCHNEFRGTRSDYVREVA
ncbi:hypothetical protein TNCV_1671131 [Trichonephila clavipes]|nr:hypothetical protein TNCV_1671131 [Trichonephila clavipes]